MNIKNWIKNPSSILEIISCLIAMVGLVISIITMSTVSVIENKNVQLIEIISNISNQNEQLNQQVTDIKNQNEQLNQQITDIKNNQINTQTTTILQPRENDVIIKDENTNTYKLIQLLKLEDFQISDTLYERKKSINDVSDKDKILISEDSNCYSYTIESIYIDPSKIANLQGIIKNINIYFEFYEKESIASNKLVKGDDVFKISFELTEDKIELSKTNETSKYYIKNGGIDYIKINIEIEYNINGRTLNNSFSPNYWCKITEDYFKD